MSDRVECEHCGKAVQKSAAFELRADGWPHFFCSEKCKIEWGELDEIADEEGY